MPPPRWAPGGARVIAHGSEAVVFERRGVAYGCVGRAGRRFRLPVPSAPHATAPPRPDEVVVSGPFAAYEVGSCVVDVCTSSVEVSDLRTGRLVKDLPAATGPGLPESAISVATIVLRPNGSVAWIALNGSVVRTPDATYEVHRADPRPVLLDSGKSIRPRSLRLRGATLSWQHGGATRTAGIA